MGEKYDKNKEITIKLKEFQAVAAKVIHDIAEDDMTKSLEYLFFVSVLLDNIFNDKKRDEIHKMYKRMKKENPELEAFAKYKTKKIMEMILDD